MQHRSNKRSQGLRHGFGETPISYFLTLSMLIAWTTQRRHQGMPSNLMETQYYGHQDSRSTKRCQTKNVATNKALKGAFVAFLPRSKHRNGLPQPKPP